MACSIPLAHLSTQVDTVSWSPDNRLAVTTNEAVYVFTLKSVTHATPSSSKTKPPLIMTTAQLPENQTTLDVGVFHLPGPYIPKLQPGGMNVAQYLDRALTNQSCDHFKASDWSPPGCSHLGGCLLCCLTISGKLLLYSAPGYLATRWELVNNLTEVLRSHLTLCGFTPARSGNNDVDGRPAMRLPNGEVYARRRYMVTCVTFAWLPTLLLREEGQATAVVAMAMKSGHIVFYGMEVPLTRKSPPALSLLLVTELPEARGGGACSLAWESSGGAAVLTVGCTDGTVVNLYWNQLALTSDPPAPPSDPPAPSSDPPAPPSNPPAPPSDPPAPSSDPPAPPSDPPAPPSDPPAPSSDPPAPPSDPPAPPSDPPAPPSDPPAPPSDPPAPPSDPPAPPSDPPAPPSDPLVPDPQLPLPKVVPLWPHTDKIPVHHIAWQRRADDCDPAPWLVFNKGPALLAFHVDPLLLHAVTAAHPLTSPPPYLLISGRHSLPVSGLCALPDRGFLSSALDGSLQRFSLPDQPPQQSHDQSCAAQVTPEPVSMETISAGKTCTCQGVAVSQNGIFAAVSINPRDDFTYKRKDRSQLHFTLLAEQTLDQQLNRISGWDVWEVIRQWCVQERELPQCALEILAAQPESLSLSQLKFQLQMSLVARKDPAATEQCVASIQHRHMVESLRAWRQWREDGCPDHQDLVSLHLMCQWLAHSSDNSELVHEVMQALPQDGSMVEFCLVCGTAVPLTSCRQEACTNGHTWRRCSVSLCLVHATRCCRCILCGALANTTESLPQGTWLHHLLKRNTRCMFCDGYFEQPV